MMQQPPPPPFTSVGPLGDEFGEADVVHRGE